METTERLDVLLEGIVDKETMGGVIAVLAIIAREKAEHIRSNWQDHDYARQWQNAANALDKAVFKVVV